MLFRIIITVLILTVNQAASSSFTIALSSSTVNAISSYSWTINFNSIASRDPIIFTFPSQVTITNNTNAVLGGTTLTRNSFTANSLNISGSTITITIPMIITITNVINPPAALTSSVAFFLTTNIETSIQLYIGNSITYTSGQLNQCQWDFSLCTEQPSSQLIVSINTANPLSSGNNRLIVGFAPFWTNLNSKSLINGVSAVACSLSIDGGVSFLSSGVTCSLDAINYKITIFFSISQQLNTSSTIIAQIAGIQSPPTKQTPTSLLYQVSTADGNGYRIDSFTSCVINPICVTNYTNGQLSNFPITVNSRFINQQTTFLAYPIITLMASDSIQIYYSPLSSLNSCNTLTFWRNTVTYSLSVNPPLPTYLDFSFPIGMAANIEYTYSINLYLQCTSIIMPSSQTSNPFTFRFFRNGSLYLQLNATITPTAAVLNASTASLALSSNQMGASNTLYTFQFVINQPLSSTPSIKIVFASDIGISGVTCSASLSNGTVIATTCTTAGSTLSINFTAGGIISVPNNIILSINGLTNPLQPTIYLFGITTYYDSTLSTSRVEYNAAAVNTSYTVITNVSVLLTPSSFTVYTITPVNISLNCPLNLPANSTFYISFPPDVPQLTFSSTQPLLVNGVAVTLASALQLNANSSFSFSTLQSILKNSSLVIFLSIRSPNYVKIFSFVTLSISKNGVQYVSSLNSMSINVNNANSMPLTIAPLNSVTGALTQYTIILTVTIPHPANFQVLVNVPSDTQFVNSGASCSGNCQTSITYLNATQFSFTATNPTPNSTTPLNLIFTITNFTNFRSIGAGMLWNITTSSNSSMISLQSGSPVISLPNILSGALDPTQTYYRSNPSNVKFNINLTNHLISSDYLLLSMDRTTYDINSTVNCSSLYAVCSLQSSTTANVLVIRVIPNNYFSNPLFFQLEGIISGANTQYLQTDYITVGSYTSSNTLMDQGKITYNIGCRDAVSLPNNCKTCYTNGSCISCYTTTGYYLSGLTCVTNCGNASQYLAFGNSTSGVCQNCGNGCLTCSSATVCMSCTNNSYYLYTDSFSCQIFCNIYAGYIVSSINTIQTCVPCADPFCIQCTTPAYGSCLRCNNNSMLTAGICSSSCLNISYYILNSQCALCDGSCYSCYSGGNGGCIRCALSYVNSSNFCVQTCPTGTAVVPTTLSCGCDPRCLSCASSNYAYCIVCANASQFVSSGQCLSSCPIGTFFSSSVCITCSTGCLNCTINTCLGCQPNWYLHNNVCYTDCKQISQQYDVVNNNSCVLCPTGCNTCSGTVCSSCLSSYTLSSSQCIQTCSLEGNCPINSNQILPLPGLISFVIWLAIVVAIHELSHTNYVPYSIMLFSSLIELILIVGTLSTSNSQVSSRLLLSSTPSYITTIQALFGVSLGLNYLFNFTYIVIFIKYIKPLILNPRQIDIISNTVVIVVGTLTNYRFALLAYAKMFPKPNIKIKMQSKLTPVHYLCIASIITDIFPVVACGMGLFKVQQFSTLYMLCLDLMIIIAINIAITIWFVSSKKTDKYFQQDTKYQVQDAVITDQNIQPANEKDNSKINIMGGESVRYEDVHNQQEQANYVQNYKLENLNTANSQQPLKSKIANQHQQNIPQTPNVNKNNGIIQVQSKPINQANPYNDVNFEQHLQPRKRQLLNNSKMTDFSGSDQKIIKESSQNERYRYNASVNFNKEVEIDNNERYHKDSNIEEAKFQYESDFPQLQENSQKNETNKSVFGTKQKLIRPKRVSTDKGTFNFKKQMTKSMNQPPNMKKNKQNKFYEESEKEDSNDFQSILKKKIQEGNAQKVKDFTTDYESEENDFQDISPTKYNVQNQRFGNIDLDKEAFN